MKVISCGSFLVENLLVSLTYLTNILVVKNMTTNQDTAAELLWKDITLTVPDSKDSSLKNYILDNISGLVKKGEVMALMGPSGSGKTTLLNVLAHRSDPRLSQRTGNVLIDGNNVTMSMVRKLTSFVEQEDSLIGSLTVEETLEYSAKFKNVPAFYIKDLVMKTLKDVGLYDQRRLKIGTPIQKGISGGQKRRVSIASQVISTPSILFLDEPTSGLDSVAAKEVIQMIKRIAIKENIIVVCSIHQPSTQTFETFDKVLFLAKGKTVYNDDVDKLVGYFNSIGYVIPPYMNPSEYVLDLISTEFSGSLESEDNACSTSVLKDLISKWNEKGPRIFESTISKEKYSMADFDEKLFCKPCVRLRNWILEEYRQTSILLSRSLLKARRDVFAYYVRMIMYFGLAIMMGTVWLRLNNDQKNIQPFINAIFFSGAFMSFMSVAYIPAYLEDYNSYKRERLNGMYGPFSFVLSSFIIGLPFLFIIALMFSIITYFMCNFRHSSTGFSYYVMWLFLDLVAAESMTTFIASLFPNFVVALALTAFANGLWMSVGGFLVSQDILNVFWYYTFYWVDYQRYVFQGMMFNEFSERAFKCDSSCHCMYNSDLAEQCKIRGIAILQTLGYSSYEKGQWIGILVALIFIYRIGSLISLKLKK
ncbi:uncharacterized protein PRCAT00005788001 [Priceomyces carsonii]|uniref:uncharacterized protein n=1 Tax=Priceomyces carsonii TaxID=28549 RepID=UPI002ED9310C|nr:unnamed protein product [Priceomyces carsonii]